MSNQADKDRIIEKIKKCLALGKSCEPHEAALALKRAQEMMERHGITTEDISLSGIGRSAARVGAAKRPPRYFHYLISMICNVFGCQAILEQDYNLMTNRYATDVSFIGFTPSPELAAYSYEVLSGQLITGRKQYLSSLNKRLKRSTKTRRGDLWAESWVKSAAQKAIPLSLSNEKEELIRKWQAREYDRLTKTSPRATKFRGRGDVEAVCKGIAAGSKAMLNHGVHGSGPGQLKIGQ